jgi:ribosome-associated protein
MAAEIDSDLEVGRYSIPSSELTWSFGTSGGPGGQHANRSNTRAELRYDLAGSDVFPDGTKRLMLEQLGNRVVDGVVVVSVDESRSQWRNRSIARKRLTEWLESSMRRPNPRKKTRPTRASKRRRLENKRVQSEKKRLRKPPRPD